MSALMHRQMIGALSVSLLAVLGCGSDTTAPAPASLVSQYWSLTFDHHAITLATVSPYDTLTLTATARTSSGAPLEVGDSVIYTTNDTTVLVSPTGFLKVHAARNRTGIMIIATMTVGGKQGLTLTDTALVDVKVLTLAAVPVVKSFSIQPQPGDSAVQWLGDPNTAVGNNRSIAHKTLDINDKDISALRAYYHVAPNQVVAKCAGVYAAAGCGLTLQSVGRVMVYADAVLYGQAVADSVLITVGYPQQSLVTIDTSMATGVPTVKGFSIDTVFISPGGMVVWRNALYGMPNDSVDIEFADPTTVQPMVTNSLYNNTPFAGGLYAGTYTYHSKYFVYSAVFPDGGGNIAPFGEPAIYPDTVTGGLKTVYDSVSSRARRFPVAGTYEYHSRFFPGSAVVQVIPNSSIQ
jgi:hypothetical protein